MFRIFCHLIAISTPKNNFLHNLIQRKKTRKIFAKNQNRIVINCQEREYFLFQDKFNRFKIAPSYKSKIFFVHYTLIWSVPIYNSTQLKSSAEQNPSHKLDPAQKNWGSKGSKGSKRWTKKIEENFCSKLTKTKF